MNIQHISIFLNRHQAVLLEVSLFIFKIRWHTNQMCAQLALDTSSGNLEQTEISYFIFFISAWYAKICHIYTSYFNGILPFPSAITSPTDFGGNNLKLIFEDSSGRSHKILPREGPSRDFYYTLAAICFLYNNSCIL